ncbi:DUF397 domain-containing protein [Streptomonospora nanhaiensis]|uniref:DUF397 domain-containing protein n=1 Tax=Streptomonospora nanhaiensis TaxID=1323731 RepID=A0A853BQI8_9ACTN|nr:DUF397 domain-containing protein [Streptomonospora nanhaiensis]MBV2365118.1 DUF397 domain-containing protein [Streptomonospora nanhaiensis]MBX9388223.1 DUF397 domain-containing protein [Streptomonospora nanhaiensis]NYI96672.1 hypothetical protein [Streptomonospora nanhaiensis]
MVKNTAWHKSTYSDTGGHCVEVTEGVHTFVRDTQHRHLGHLAFPAAEWDAFLAALRRDTL